LITSNKIGRVRTWRIAPAPMVAVQSWILEQRKLWEGRTDRLVEYVEDWYERETNMAANQNDFTISRFIRAPRRVVWKAWTMPEHLEQWWCPKPMTAKIGAFALRPGGAFDLLMSDPKGTTTLITGAFLEIVPEERIIFTTALTTEWRPATTLLPITAIIAMTPEGSGTRYETRVLVKDEEERKQLQAIDFEAGWSIGIDQLETLVIQLE